MDNIKTFEDFLDRMKGLLDNAKKQGHIIVRVEDLENAFPELRESEDERIRKTLIEYIKGIKSWNYFLGISKEQMIAWLEKQGKQKPINKAEPMFKVGNWYQCVKDFFGKGVTFDKNTAYYCAKEGCLQNEYGCHIAIVKDLYDNFKLWTLDYAKDGDILAFHDEYIFIYNNTSILQAYCYYHTKDDKFCIEDRTHHHKWVMSEVKPATKEQCDLLFSKIKETGHEWSEETHELKKIEQKSQRMISAEAKEALYDKSAWSEEDERLYRGLQDLIYSTPYCNSRKKISDWLKSLKDRCTWKPSEGQMEAMENLIINIIRNPLLLDNYTQSNIRSLCDDLRKLVIIR